MSFEQSKHLVIKMLNNTYMQHQLQQKGADSVHQKQPLYIVPSCGYHIDEVIL